MRINLIIGFLLSIIFLSGCTQVAEEKPLQEINVKLKWLHQAQFAGNYMAAEKGFYAEEGLKANLEAFSFEDTSIDSVVKGDASFGITSASELVLARLQGKPLKAIGVIFKINPDCAYSLKERGIEKPQDFMGKTVGIEPGVSGEVSYSVMMNRLGLDRTKVNEMYIGYDATELLNGTTDVSLGYIINEPHQAIEAGKDINIILFADYGVNMYADVLFATEDTINNNPELVEKFLRATLNGWQYAIENEDETVDVILKYATDRTKSHEAYMLKTEIPLIHTGESPLGWMDEEGWEQVQGVLLTEGIIEEQDKKLAQEFYTSEFLEKIYE